MINPYITLNLIKETVLHIDKAEKEAIDTLAYCHDTESKIWKEILLQSTIEMIKGIEEIELEILNLIYLEK